MEKYGVLFVGHGTRFDEGRTQFWELFQQFARRLDPVPSAAAFLELAQPDIPFAVGALARQGVDRLVVVPALLFSAGHARFDIPHAVARAAKQHGIVVAGYSHPLDLHPTTITVSMDRFAAVVPHHSASSAVLFLGRGSSDPAAVERFLLWATRRAEAQCLANWKAAFLFGAPPKWQDGIAWLASQSVSQRVVQPHLLFPGRLMNRIREAVAVHQAEGDGKPWFLVPELGPHPALAAAFFDRATDLLPPEQCGPAKG